MTTEDHLTYESFLNHAQKSVQAVHDDPMGRLTLQQNFYRQYGKADSYQEYGLGQSKIDFMQWEIDRGVLNSLTAAQPGSPWWRAVNEQLLLDTEVARLIFESNQTIVNLPKTVRSWLRFLAQPSPKSWYRAHNTSIANGYLKFTALAKKECQTEQLFINSVLYRVLYAQAMIEDKTIFVNTGRWIANPRLPSIKTIVNIHTLYPTAYPLTKDDILNLHDKTSAIKALDTQIILPQAKALYTAAARWLALPTLLSLLDHNNQPIYPQQKTTPNAPKKKTKIAVLGGGTAALSAVFALTSPNNLKHEEYEITVYQIGWRLGGKAATGRNRHMNHRIEEHGLHLWNGSYTNAFGLMRECYEELARSSGERLATFDEAFEPMNTVHLARKFNGTWDSQSSYHAPNNQTLGRNEGFHPISEYIMMSLRGMSELLSNTPLFVDSKNKQTNTMADHTILPTTIQKLIQGLAEDAAFGTRQVGKKLLRTAEQIIKTVIDTQTEPSTEEINNKPTIKSWLQKKADYISSSYANSIQVQWENTLVNVLDYFIDWLWKKVKTTVDTDISTYQFWTGMSFTYALIRGILVDEVHKKGLASLNEYDFREWLEKHAFDDGGILQSSAVVASRYTPSFAYIDGNNTVPPEALFAPNAAIEAGTALSWLIRETLTYNKAVMFYFKSGTAETIFTPIYQVLLNRGVKFKFFHRVLKVIPSADGQKIVEIQIAEQVKLASGIKEYNPLYEVNQLLCWPSEPFYEQLEGAQKIEKENINFEQTPASWQDAGIHTLIQGIDFDNVILGIPPPAFPAICPDLLATSQKWRKMHTTLKNIATAGVQIWQKPHLHQLGWPTMYPRPVMTTFEDSYLDTWADMSHLIPEEGWMAENYPLNLSYFTGGLLEETPFEIKDLNAGDFGLDQKSANLHLRGIAQALLEKKFAPFWPSAYDANTKAYKWSNLISSKENKGKDKHPLDDQYIRANIMPTERYILCVPGSSKHRLPTHDPQEFTNLYLAGDWTKNGVNVGSMEGAVTSGLLASSALTGYPREENIARII